MFAFKLILVLTFFGVHCVLLYEDWQEEQAAKKRRH